MDSPQKQLLVTAVEQRVFDDVSNVVLRAFDSHFPRLCQSEANEDRNCKCQPTKCNN